MSAEERLSLAWGLKDVCHSAWSSEPQRAVRAAEALRGLLEAIDDSSMDDRIRTELVALSCWADAIADIICGRMTDAEAGLDRADAGFRAIGKPGHAAQTQVPKIMVLGILGRHAQAAKCAEKTKVELTRLGDLPTAAKVSLNLGNLQMERDAYSDATRNYREAAVLFSRAGDREHSIMADIGLADALTATGDFAEASRIFARARMRAAAHGLPVLEALIEGSSALLDLSRGNYRDALRGLERSRQRWEQMEMPQNLAISEKQLGYAYLELRLLPEAMALLDDAVEKFERLGMAVEQAWALSQRGRALVLQGRRALASDSLVAAAQLFAEHDSPVGGAAVALVRAELALANGDPQEALALAETASQAFADAGQVPGRTGAEAVVAAALLDSGHVAAAGARFEACLESAETLQLLPAQVRCLTGLGRVARAEGRIAAAAEWFESAVERFEDQRRALPGDDIRSAYLTDHLQPYQALLGLALEAPESATDEGASARAARVLWQLDRMRARALAERMSHGNERESDEPDALGELRTRLNWLYRRVDPSAEGADGSAHWQDEIRRAEQTLLERARRQRLAAASSVEVVGLDDGFSVPALQAHLGEGDALVEYGVVGDELFCCVATASRVQLIRNVASWAVVQQAVRSTCFQIESLRHGAAQMSSHMAQLEHRARIRLTQLGGLLWAPLRSALAGIRRVLVVPHGELARVPFGALTDGDRYLADTIELAVAPSARVALYGLLRKPVIPECVLSLGESSRLPHAGAEAELVASLFPRGHSLVGSAATVAALQEMAGSADVLHLACHAQFRIDSPMFSALQLADGALTAEQAEALSLKPGVVVLSACETGLAGDNVGDEIIGLVRAFMVAGAARVVGSLWPVDDRVTSDFMTHFYSALKNGDSPATALRGAQLAVRATHPHPFHWAAFTLHGGW